MAARLAVVATYVAAVSAAAAATCGGNNCNRAVLASNYPTRPTKADCSAFLATTVTPPVYTSTSTSTVWLTDFTTVTTVQPTTVSITDTEFATVTSLSTEVDTLTAFETVTITNSPLPQVTDKKRDVVAVPTIPAYASPCSSAAAYSTACACIGVTPITYIAATPTTVVGTVVTSTSTITTTVTSATVLTQTLTEVHTSTQGQVVTLSTTVVATATATVTASPPPECDLRLSTVFFSLQVQGLGLTTPLTGYWVFTNAELSVNPGGSIMNISPNKGSAERFNTMTTANLWINSAGQIANELAGSTADVVRFNPSADTQDPSRSITNCSISPDPNDPTRGDFTCTNGALVEFVSCVSDGYLKFVNGPTSGCEQIKLVAVCPVAGKV